MLRGPRGLFLTPLPPDCPLLQPRHRPCASSACAASGCRCGACRSFAQGTCAGAHAAGSPCALDCPSRWGWLLWLKGNWVG